MNKGKVDALFEWDAEKSRSNESKHNVSFIEAASVLYDYLSSTIYDHKHSSIGEARFVTIGKSGKNRILVVVHCDRGEKIRIISARKANKDEKRNYEKGSSNRQD